MSRSTTMQVLRNSCLASLLVVVVAAAACGQTQTNASAQTDTPAPSRRARSAPAQSVAASREPIVIEFDVPDEFRSQRAGSANAVTGFRVGYFKSGGETTPVRTIDFGRDALVVKNTIARVSLPRDSIPDCGGNCDIRVQTLAGKQASAWSEPVPVGGAAVRQGQPSPQPPAVRREQPRASRTDRPRDPAAAARKTGLGPDDIEKHTALSDTLRKLLPADASIDTELGRFRRIEELALAVVISRDYDIPFTTLTRTLEGPPRLAPRNALTKLRQDVDARDAIRKSRAAAQKLMAVP